MPLNRLQVSLSQNGIIDVLFSRMMIFHDNIMKQPVKQVQDIVTSCPKSQRCVLVATYKKEPDQLKWINSQHLYNYPLSEEEAKSPNNGWVKVKEIWLYSGPRDRQYAYDAEFVAIKSREAFLAENPEYPKSKGNKTHGNYYAIFNVHYKYQPTINDSIVTVRIGDFTRRTPKIAQAIKAYQSGDELGSLLEYLPSALAPLNHNQLFVCEAELQLAFWDLPHMETLKPLVPFPPPSHPQFTFIDLFAGIGGFRLALQECGGKCVFSSEWDAAAQDTYYRNYGEYPYGDITKESTKAAIPDRFDILCAGFPCQPFSLAGVSARVSLNKEHGFADKTQGTLFFDIIQIVKKHHPKVLFLENVRNLVNHDEGRTFKVIKESIEHEGYSFNYRVIDASPLVPQKRLRCYMVCIRDGGKFEFPEITGTPLPLRSILEENVPEQFTISDNLWAGHQRRTSKNLARGTGFTAFTANLDEPSHTLVARYYKDGKECLIPQEGKNPRLLTPRECARLQGFPENFILPSSRSIAYKQMGNSVAVPVLRRIAECIDEQILKGVNNGI